MANYKLVSVSELPSGTSLENLVVFATNNSNDSVKVPITLLKGNKGDSPVVGANGNWWVGTTDTGVPSVVAVSQVKGQDTVKAPSLKLFTDDGIEKQKVILNVSQLNNKYDYADKIAARSAVLASLRGLGQVISYRLSSQEWITEKFIGSTTTEWTTESNWNDRFKSLEAISGIGYKQKEQSTEFKNLIPSYDNVLNKYLDKNNVEQTSRFTGYHAYNQAYTPVLANTTYLGNAPDYNPTDEFYYLFYDSAKVFLGWSFGFDAGKKFTTPANTSFVRYNYRMTINTQVYIYKDESISYEPNLSVNLALNDIVGSKIADISNSASNILPETVSMGAGALSQANIVRNLAGWYYLIGYLAVKGGTSYITNLTSVDVTILFFDSDKRLISTVGRNPDNQAFGQFLTPVNCAYIRFNSKLSGNMSTSYIREEGSTTPVYFPNLYIPSTNIIDDLTPVVKTNYIALGDSLTEGQSYAQKMALTLEFPFTNKAVGGTTCIGSSGSLVLITQVNSVAAGYTGLITIMIGTNDCWHNLALGDADATIAKSFASLSLTANFCEAFRINLQTLLGKCPNATIVCVSPPYAAIGASNPLGTYREASRKICDYLSIPYIDIYNKIYMNKENYNLYMDGFGVHPNETIHMRIAKLLARQVKLLL